MNVSRLDHIVMTVRDINETVQFYETVLGMTKETFGGGRVALAFGTQKINLHQLGMEFEPNAGNATPGSADVCFIVDTPLSEAQQHLSERGVEIVDGPVHRIGATGPIVSLYFRDPDQNLIEISNYDTN